MNNEQNTNQSLKEDREENNVKKEWTKPELQLIEVNKNTKADLGAAHFDGLGFS